LDLQTKLPVTRKRLAKSAVGGRRRKIKNSQENNWEPVNDASATEDPQRFLSEDFLLVLDEHRKNCEREGKFDEAQ